MTVSVGWMNEGNLFRYRFSPEWTWKEFHSARKIAETLIRNSMDKPEDSETLIDVIIDYSDVGNWFPKMPSKKPEPYMTEPEEEKVPDVPNRRKSKRRNGKGKHTQKHGNDPVAPRESFSPNVPDAILEEHKWIVSVGSFYVTGATERALRMFKTMMLPAYEWDYFETTDSLNVVELEV